MCFYHSKLRAEWKFFKTLWITPSETSQVSIHWGLVTLYASMCYSVSSKNETKQIPINEWISIWNEAWYHQTQIGGLIFLCGSQCLFSFCSYDRFITIFQVHFTVIANSWGQVTHICVSKLGHLWFRSLLVAWSAPSHYLKQCWNIVNWTIGNKLQWNLDRNLHIFNHENIFENVWKIAPILPRSLFVMYRWCNPEEHGWYQSNPIITGQQKDPIVCIILVVYCIRHTCVLQTGGWLCIRVDKLWFQPRRTVNQYPVPLIYMWTSGFNIDICYTCQKIICHYKPLGRGLKE